MRWRTAPLAQAALLIAFAVNVWLLATIATELLSDTVTPVDKVDWKPGLPAAVGSVTGRRPIDTYTQILARPIFFKSRLPFVPTPAPPSAPMMQSAPPVLTDPGLGVAGVMIKNDIRKAYVFSKAGATGAWTSEGDEFMGWQIKSVSGVGVQLEQHGRSIDLQLYPKP